MSEGLESIDTSVIEELTELKAQRETVLERLERLEAKRNEVSNEVYTRVKRDYDHRRRELERAAAPLLERARVEFAKLRAHIERFEAEVHQSRLDLEELDLRHELGEFDETTYTERREKGQRRLAEQETKLEEAVTLKESFVEAAGSEDALEAPISEAAPVPETLEEGALPSPASPPGRVASAPPEESPPPPAVEGAPAGATVVVEKGAVLEEPAPETTATFPTQEVAAAPPAGATMLLQWPKLELKRPSGSPEQLALAGARTRLGSAPDNDIVLEGKKVDPHHAEIVLAKKGYTVRDLGSKVGVLVNGVAITEQALNEGDEIRIGELTLVFHEP